MVSDFQSKLEKLRNKQAQKEKKNDTKLIRAIQFDNASKLQQQHSQHSKKSHYMTKDESNEEQFGENKVKTKVQMIEMSELSN